MNDMKFECPHCKQHLEIPAELFGQTVTCPTCKGQLTLPKPVTQSEIPSAPDQSTPQPMPEQQEDPVACPLCGRTESMKKAKVLYGQKVCKKCYYGFANRRNFAFAVDIFLWNIVFFVFEAIVGGFGTADSTTFYWMLSIAVFGLKDGFAGNSPGKALFGVQTMIEATGRPAGFGASFKRNLPLCIPLMFLVVSSQLLKGHRTGDGWANTKVIWKKYRTHPVFAVGNSKKPSQLAVSKPVSPTPFVPTPPMPEQQEPAIPSTQAKTPENDDSRNSAESDWKIPNAAALVFIAILATIGGYGFIWLTLGYIIVAGLSFLVCRISKKQSVRIVLAIVVVGVCLIGFFVASFAASVRSEMKKQTERTIHKTASASQSGDQESRPVGICSPPTADERGLLWNRVQAVLTDTSLTTRQKKRMWERDFQGKRVTWRGEVVMTMMDALNIKFRMNPPFQRAVDVSLFIREDQKAKGDQIYSMRTYQFSGTLDSYHGGMFPVYLKDGVVFTEATTEHQRVVPPRYDTYDEWQARTRAMPSVPRTPTPQVTPVKMRTWTGRSGVSQKAEFISLGADGVSVILRGPDGRNMHIKMYNLSKADQQYIKTMEAE